MVEYRILKPPPRRRRRIAMGVAADVVVAAAVAGGAYAFGARHGSGQAAGQSAGHPATPPAPTALTVASTIPPNGSGDVPSDQQVAIHFSVPVVAGVGMPTWSPPVAGSWLRSSPTVLTFAATAPFVPTTTETLTVASGAAGPRSDRGAVMSAPDVVTFSVAQASTERLQQLLAQLNYLPLSFTPNGPSSAPSEAITPQTGAFAWRWSTLPPDLTSLWTEGIENVITKGAVMTFENQNGLTVDGVAGRQVWTTLLTDLAAGKVDPNPYNYVFVSKQLPEALTVFSNGAPVLANIPVNTGAPGADTVDGTYPVFEHVPASRMVGTNPDGSHYDDPSVPWASYFNGGDALHGFVRATYGSPQSNGCVEMPIAQAAQVWPLSPIGTLVTVVGPPT
jgi:peptidoglycan hydrolase-like protein with peptidoglycan-binding domain